MAAVAEETLAATLRDENQAPKNRQLLAALLEVRAPQEMMLFAADEAGRFRKLAEPNADEQFRSAFARWGLEEFDSQRFETIVASLREQPNAIVQEIVAALDEWIAHRSRLEPKAPPSRLRDLADRLDDNELRRELRRIRFSPDLERERLAGGISRALLPWSELTGQPIGVCHQRVNDLKLRLDPAKEPTLTLLALRQTVLIEMGDSEGAKEAYCTSARDGGPPQRFVAARRLGAIPSGSATTTLERGNWTI